MHQVILGIGGNIGNKRENFQKVLFLIENKIGEIISKSSVYETPSWGFLAEEIFWNQVLKIKTPLEPLEILAEIQEIEKHFGRKRKDGRYSSREMDVDILYFNNQILENEQLIIPHPRIQDRKFVLVPLVEIEPDFQHPLLNLTSKQLLENCPDKAKINQIKST